MFTFCLDKGYCNVLAAALCTVTLTAHANEPFNFGLMADGPYGEPAEIEYDRLIKAVNDEELAFVIHAGDIKAGGELCTDELITRRFNQLQTIRHALLYTPGDNEWTDCHRTSNGNYLPTERLEYIRQLFFSNPQMSLGINPISVESQSSAPGYETFVENSLFEKNGVLFSQIHVVGSNNNLAPWNQIDDSDSFANPRADRLQEYNARNEAGVAWLNTTFDKAQQADSHGVFITIHANPRLDLNTTDEGRAGFNPFLTTLFNRVEMFNKPVVLAHGDFHIFLIDTPRLVPWYANEDAETEEDNRKVPNLTRVQAFGHTDNHWVEISVNTDDPAVFSFSPRVVAANTVMTTGLGLSGDVYSSTALELFWARIENAAAYEIQRDGGPVVSVVGNSYFTAELSAATEYTFIVNAVSGSGEIIATDEITLQTRQ